MCREAVRLGNRIGILATLPATMEPAKNALLAARMRPQTLNEVVGQKHIIGKGKLLYRAIIADRLSSIILYGPPETGKTTLAKVIANPTKADFKQVNATVAGKKELVDVITEAKYDFGAFNRGTILFIDEIHRFNHSGVLTGFRLRQRKKIRNR